MPSAEVLSKIWCALVGDWPAGSGQWCQISTCACSQSGDAEMQRWCAGDARYFGCEIGDGGRAVGAGGGWVHWEAERLAAGA